MDSNVTKMLMKSDYIDADFEDVDSLNDFSSESSLKPPPSCSLMWKITMLMIKL